MRLMGACAAVLAAACATSAPVRPPIALDAPTAVQVRTPEVEGELSGAVAEVTASAICQGLAGRGGANLACRTDAEVRQLLGLAATRINLDGCADPTRCAEEAAAKVKAPFVVVSTLVVGKGGVALSSKLVRAGDDAVLLTLSRTAPHIEDLPEVARALGADLAEGLTRR